MAEIKLERIAREVVAVKIKGTAPLIVNKFSEKAKQTMLDAQMGKTRQKKAPKNPEENFQASLYPMGDGRYGFPATGYKAAVVAAARYFEAITMTALKVAIRVQGEGSDQLVALATDAPKMREDPVRNASGVADLRFRGEFTDWGAELHIMYPPTLLSADSVVNLVDAAGMGGIGEWRPSAPKSMTGSYGTFEVIEQ